MQQQSVRGSQQDLEEDEQIEEITRQKCAVQAHQQKLEQRVECRCHAIPVSQRVDERGERHQRSQQQHQGGQPVHDQDDPEWRRPGADCIDAHALGPHIGHGVSSQVQQCERSGRLNEYRAESRHHADSTPLTEEHLQSTRHQRHQDGNDQQMVQQRDHESGS